MRKFFVTSLVAALVLVAPAAQASSAVAFGFGYLLGASGSGPQAATGFDGDVLYVLPHASERVKDPLQVRQVTVYEKSYVDWDRNNQSRLGNESVSISDLFRFTLKDANNYVLLVVQRFARPFDVNGNRSGINAFILTYIAKEQVVPLESLPKTQ